MFTSLVNTLINWPKTHTKKINGFEHLSESRKRAILRMARAGECAQHTAEMLGKNHTTVSAIYKKNGFKNRK